LFCLVKYTGKAQPGEVIRKALQKDTEFVGFTPDGKQVVTALREYGLLSGYHRLTYWDFAKTEGPTFLTEPPTLTLTTAAKVRSLDFDGGELREYAFPTDGKTFRSLRFERDSKGEVTRTEVVEVDGMTEEIGKTLLILDSAYTRFSHRFTFSPDGKRLGVFTNDVAKIAVYDLDRGEKLSEYKFPAERPGDFDLVLRMAFSQDGKRLVVARAIGQTVVLNADTGEALPVLEGLAMTSTSPDPQAFSGDGRLLAMRGTVHEPPRKGGIPSSGHRREVRSFLTVWDTQTGKVVKSWNRGPYAVFSPTRPVLAILEANGDSTRVGFWDFTAEVEKK
jgi:WD40 repeat protein